jgi:aryl-alcohol dehydrogenase-like predicted oxidoreductase
MGLSEFYAPVGREQAHAAIGAAVDAGIDFFDTADMYGQGANEQLLGAALKPLRSRVKICTKFGILRRREDPGFRATCGSPDYARRCVHNSLRHLNVDHIDLYYVHRIDPDVPIEETVGELSRLREAGLIEHIGLSNVEEATLRRACAVTPIAAVQNEYSLWVREAAESLLPTCRELGVGFVSYSPLGRGLLSAQIGSLDQLGPQDFRRGLTGFEPAQFARSRLLAQAFGRLAAQWELTPSTLALAWLLAKDPWIVPIPGTSRVERILQNAQAAAVVLDPAQLMQLERMDSPNSSR